MKLTHIDYAKLSFSPLNVRKHGAEDVDDLVLSIRSFGILQPLLVRERDGAFEVVAGQRRYRAYGVLVAEGMTEPLPCGVMEDGDDASAIEASLAENLERLPMDDLDQYAAFAELVAKGRSVEDIAGHFGVTERMVRQRLALANLDKRILVLYRRDEIRAETLRTLTMATRKQQKAWLKRFRDPEDHAPQGRTLRQWLLGGEQIATSAALFQLESYEGSIVTDLFGEDAYFADPESFWTLQRQAIEDAAKHYRGNGWTDIVLLEETSHFPNWEYGKVSKRNGGRVYVTVAPNGEVAFHEGYLPIKELRKAEAKAATIEGEQAKARPELTKAAQNYVDLHRHAAVQAALLTDPDLAMKSMVAHVIAASNLWSVKADPRRADTPEIAASIEGSAGYQAMEMERQAILALLGIEDNGGDALVGRPSFQWPDLDEVFSKLVALRSEDVTRILAYVMAETLAAGSGVIDTLGTMMGVSLAEGWEADAAFLDTVASKDTLKAMVADIGGEVTADAHKASTAKTMRSVILQYASGEGRPKATGWVPPHLRFPQKTYGSQAA